MKESVVTSCITLVTALLFVQPHLEYDIVDAEELPKIIETEELIKETVLYERLDKIEIKIDSLNEQITVGLIEKPKN